MEFNFLWKIVPKVVQRKRTIDSFDDCDILKFFIFESKGQLRLLYTGWRFPAHFRAPSRDTFTGEDVFLVSIRRLFFLIARMSPSRTLISA